MVNRPLPDAARDRALEYLARIRRLEEVQSGRIRDRKGLLLPVLAACLECPRVLFPHLGYLEVHTRDIRSARVDCIATLIPPTLKVLKITTDASHDDKLGLLILELAKERGCNLEAFTDNNSPLQRLPEVLVFFKTLQDMKITPSYPLLNGSSITIFQFLTSLPHLRSLTCNLVIFVRCTTEQTIRHTNLQRMDIISPSISLWELFQRCIFPSVTELTVRTCNDTCHSPGVEKYPDPGRPPFDGLDTSCPNVQDLRLCACQILPVTFGLKHFVPLLSLPVRLFDLDVDSIDLTPSDLRIISESWTNLYSFKIPAINTFYFDALPYLAAFSNHSHLSHLDLNIRPHFFLRNISRVPGMIAAHTLTQVARPNPCTVYLITLCGPDPDEVPVITIAEKRSLVEYLLLLFPSLKLESE